MRPLDRRTFLSLGSLTLAGCASESPYFGNTQPPSRQELTCAMFATGGSRFDALLAAADAAPSRAVRLQRLAACERFLLARMPLIPIHLGTYSSLVKPYVRGWASNALNEHQSSYVWIDQNWRPSA